MKKYKGKLRFKDYVYEFETSNVFEYWLHITTPISKKYCGILDCENNIHTKKEEFSNFLKSELKIILPIEEI